MKIIRPFFFGIIAAFSSLFLELFMVAIFFENKMAGGLIDSRLSEVLIISAAIEEIMKFFFVYENALLTEKRTHYFPGALLVGLGFGLVETAGIYWNSPGSIYSVFSLTGVLLTHIATAGFMGYILSKLKEKSWLAFAGLIIIALAAHLAYNALIIYAVSDLSAYVFQLVMVILLLAMFLSSRHPQPEQF